jgi:hypothetical protein
MLASCLAPCGQEDLLNNNELDAPSDLFASDDGMQEDDTGRFPSWLQDSDASLCFGCANKFSKTFRKHHCRRCRSIFCKSCSGQKSHIVALKTSKPVRVCGRCHSALQEENAYLQHEFSLLQRGETFKCKQAGAFGIFRGSAKFVCLRLMSDEHTLIYDDDSSNEPIQINPNSITNITPSGFTSFGVVTESKTHTFEAETASLCKNWIAYLNNFMTKFHSQPLKEEVEMERQAMNIKCAELRQNNESRGGTEEEPVALRPEERRQNRKQQRQQLKDKYNL